jgi:predicted ATP-grasp superfamily ATP-dependent carboligase
MNQARQASRHTALVIDGFKGSALAAARSLGRAGWSVLVPEKTPLAASRYATEAVGVPDAVTRPQEFIERVEELVETRAIDLIAPSSDASLFLLHERCAFGEGAPSILGGTRASFRATEDKAAILKSAEAAGFPTPRWVVPANSAEALRGATTIGYPCVVKSRRSYLFRGRFFHRRHHFVSSREELLAAVDELADGERAPIIQQAVLGRSLAVSAVVQRGRSIATAARETFSFDPLKGGTSVWKRTVPLNDVGVADALHLLHEIRFEGLAEVEYQVDAQGVPRLMEVNARLHGWVSLAVAAGVDLPLAAACAAIDEPYRHSTGYQDGVEMRWPGGEIHRLRQLLKRRPELAPGTTRLRELRKAWPPWRPGMRYDGLDRDDPGPAVARLLGSARRSEGATTATT